MLNNIELLAQLIVLLSVVPYAGRIIQGKITPNRVTWLVWAFIGIALAFVTWTNPNSTLLAKVFASILAFNPALIFILSAVKNQGIPMSTIEKWALGIGVLGIIVWIGYKIMGINGITPIIILVVADAVALIPTILFVLKSPNEDRPAAWFCFAIGSLLNLMIVPVSSWTLDNQLLPGYMLCGASCVIFILVRYRIKNRVPLRDWI